MAMKPIYFDLSVKELRKARAFFEAAFGWRFERVPMPYEYYRIQAGPEDEYGIDGGMGAIQDAPVAEGRPLSVFTMQVESIDSSLKLIEASGGLIVEPKTAIPGVGWYATCAEPGGLKLGILQADPEAASPKRQ